MYQKWLFLGIPYPTKKYPEDKKKFREITKQNFMISRKNKLRCPGFSGFLGSGFFGTFRSPRFRTWNFFGIFYLDPDS